MNNRGRTRLVWTKKWPDPFESAWSVFLKLTLLNYCRFDDIARQIQYDDVSSKSACSLLSSSWIDFERFARLLDVDPYLLKSGFLDQLGFPCESLQDRSIRTCPECLRHGYHCTLFNLAIVAECPFHGVPFTAPCKLCFEAIQKGRLIKGSGSRQLDGAIMFDGGSLKYGYHAPCGHFAYIPESYRAVQPFTPETRKTIQQSCESMIRWWLKIGIGQGAEPGLVDGLVSSEIFDASTSGSCVRIPPAQLSLDIAISIAGPCPWPTIIEPAPATFIKFEVKAQNGRAQGMTVPWNSSLGRIYRSIRRHLFKKYVKPSHRSCWSYMRSISLLDSRCLGSDSFCTTVTAYMSWRMSNEGFSNVEVFKLKRRLDQDLVPVLPVTPDEKVVAQTWFANFLALVATLEWKARKGGHFYIERSSEGGGFNGIVKVDRGGSAPRENMTVLLAFGSPEHALRNSEMRCLARGNHPEKMLDNCSVAQMAQWSWVGYYDLYNKQHLLFRVRDKKSSLNSYDTLQI